MILNIFSYLFLFSLTFGIVEVPHRELHTDFHAPFYNEIDPVIVVSE